MKETYAIKSVDDLLSLLKVIRTDLAKDALHNKVSQDRIDALDGFMYRFSQLDESKTKEMLAEYRQSNDKR